MVLRAPAPIASQPLELVERDDPVPAAGEVRVRVRNTSGSQAFVAGGDQLRLTLTRP